MENEILKDNSSNNKNELKYTSYYKDITKINNREKSVSGKILDYSQAEQEVVDYLTEKKVLRMSAGSSDMNLNRNLTKQDLRDEKKYIRKLVSECIYSKGFQIRGYQSNEKLEKFISEMVSEYAGYSVLEDAFNDPDVDDIYCIEWNKIYVERMKNYNLRGIFLINI